MCEIKTVLFVAVLLLAVNGFCIYQVKSRKKLGQHSEIKSESPCEKEYKKYCLNGGECYRPYDEGIVGCNCTWLYGGKRCEKYMCWTYVKYFHLKSAASWKFQIKNWRVVKEIDSKSDTTKKNDSKSDKTKSFYSKSCFLEFLLRKRALKKFFFLQNHAFWKLHVKRKICAFYGLNWIKTWFFECNFCSKFCFSKISFFWKLCFLKKFFLQNHAFKKNSDSKSDAL